MSEDLKAIRGDTWTWEFTATLSAGTPYNLNADKYLWFTVKKSPLDTDHTAVIRKRLGDGITVTNAAAGLGEVTLVKSDFDNLGSALQDQRGRYYFPRFYYDLQVLEISTQKVYTLEHGEFAVILDITKTGGENTIPTTSGGLLLGATGSAVIS